MADLEIYELHYTKADLELVPEADRLSYLLATGLANDIQSLYKVFAATIADDRDDLITRQANSTLAMVILRALAGRLWEGRTWLQKSFGTIAGSYENEFSDEAKESLASLRSYFARKSHLVGRVRNGVAFHADPKVVKEAFDRLPSDVDMGDYFSETLGNSLFYSAEMLQYEAIHGFAAKAAQPESLKELAVEVKSIAVDFLSVILGFMNVFLKRHLRKQYDEMWERRTVLNDVATLDQLKLPFFVVVPKPGGAAEKVVAPPGTRE